MSDLLLARDLRVRYPLDGGLASMLNLNRRSCVDVVHGVSLNIRRGETLAVVGESGSGKTTLAMAMCGLAPLAGGEVHFDGTLLATSADGYLRPDRRRIAMMFQDPVGSLSPRMTVRKLLAEPMRFEPVVENGKKTYKITGKTKVGVLLDPNYIAMASPRGGHLIPQLRTTSDVIYLF